jgi:hypothetical protein
MGEGVRANTCPVEEVRKRVVTSHSRHEAFPITDAHEAGPPTVLDKRPLPIGI